MRLREIQQVLKKNIDLLKFEVASLSNNNAKATNIQITINAIDEIEQTGLFPGIIKELKTIEEIYLTSYDELTVPSAVAEKFKQRITTLKQNSFIVFQGLEDVLGKQHEYAVNIKLPQIHDLNGLQNIVSELDKIFNQLLVNEYVKGKITLDSFDTGSFWLGFIIEGLIALTLFASFIQLVMSIKAKKLQDDRFIEETKTRQISNELRQELSNQLLQQTQLLRKQQIRQMIKDGGISDKDHEYQKRIDHCIDLMMQLIDKGVQVVPSLNAPDDVKSKFPDFLKPLEMALPLLRKELPEKT